MPRFNDRRVPRSIICINRHVLRRRDVRERMIRRRRSTTGGSSEAATGVALINEGFVAEKNHPVDCDDHRAVSQGAPNANQLALKKGDDDWRGCLIGPAQGFMNS